jgi:hypothetical protein
MGDSSYRHSLPWLTQIVVRLCTAGLHHQRCLVPAGRGPSKAKQRKAPPLLPDDRAAPAASAGPGGWSPSYLLSGNTAAPSGFHLPCNLQALT